MQSVFDPAAEKEDVHLFLPEGEEEHVRNIEFYADIHDIKIEHHISVNDMGVLCSDTLVAWLLTCVWRVRPACRALLCGVVGERCPGYVCVYK